MCAMLISPVAARHDKMCMSACVHLRRLIERVIHPATDKQVHGNMHATKLINVRPGNVIFFFRRRTNHVKYVRPGSFVSCIYISIQTRPCLVTRKFCKIFHIPCHIESLDAYMKY